MAGRPSPVAADAILLPRSRLGLIGCLESMLFAVDPFQMMFYFG